MLIAHKITLDPNNAQATYFTKAAGVARFAYNWALAEWKRQYDVWKADNSLPRPSQMALRRQLNAIKREQFPWMLEVYQVRTADGDHPAWRCVQELLCRTCALPAVSQEGRA